MPINSFRISQRNLNIRIAAIGGKVIKEVAENEAREKVFEPAVAKMRQEFDSHPITQEIQVGVDSPNLSETLQGDLRDVGNLYSFIGFEDGTDPIAPLREFFDEGVAGGPSLNFNKVSPKELVWTFSAVAPNSKQIHDSTPVPWAGGLSWVKRVETGIPGASRFFREKGYGRSRGGIQMKRELGRIRFVPKTYLSMIISNFIKRISGRRRV